MKMALVLGLIFLISSITGEVLERVRPVRKIAAGLPWPSAMAVAPPMPPALVPVMTTAGIC
jgi:hypothetical protein